MGMSLLLLASVLAAVPSEHAEGREVALWNLVQRHDMTAFRNELDPGFVAVYADAVNDGAAEVKAMEAQKLQSFAITNLTVKPLAEAVELVTYDVAATGRFRGSDISGKYRATSIWKKDGDAWKLAYHGEVKAE